MQAELGNRISSLAFCDSVTVVFFLGCTCGQHYLGQCCVCACGVCCSVVCALSWAVLCVVVLCVLCGTLGKACNSQMSAKHA